MINLLEPFRAFRLRRASFDAIIAFMADSRANLDTSERRAHEYMGSWSSHVASWMSVPHRPVLVLRYEDLLAAPEKTFGALASFLQLKPTAVQLGRAVEHSCFPQLTFQEEREGFNERPTTSRRFFRKGRFGEWKERLTPTQVRAVLDTHAPMMRWLGYISAPTQASRSGALLTGFAYNADHLR